MSKSWAPPAAHLGMPGPPPMMLPVPVLAPPPTLPPPLSPLPVAPVPGGPLPAAPLPVAPLPPGVAPVAPPLLLHPPLGPLVPAGGMPPPPGAPIQVLPPVKTFPPGSLEAPPGEAVSRPLLARINQVVTQIEEELAEEQQRQPHLPWPTSGSLMSPSRPMPSSPTRNEAKPLAEDRVSRNLRKIEACEGIRRDLEELQRRTSAWRPSMQPPMQTLVQPPLQPPLQPLVWTEPAAPVPLQPLAAFAQVPQGPEQQALQRQMQRLAGLCAKVEVSCRDRDPGRPVGHAEQALREVYSLRRREQYLRGELAEAEAAAAAAERHRRIAEEGRMQQGEADHTHIRDLEHQLSNARIEVKTHEARVRRSEADLAQIAQLERELASLRASNVRKDLDLVADHDRELDMVQREEDLERENRAYRQRLADLEQQVADLPVVTHQQWPSSARRVSDTEYTGRRASTAHQHILTKRRHSADTSLGSSHSSPRRSASGSRRHSHAASSSAVPLDTGGRHSSPTSHHHHHHHHQRVVDVTDYEAAQDTRAVALEREAALCRASIEHKQEHLGPDHPETLAEVARLARLFHEAGHLNEAEELYRRVLREHERVLGHEHEFVLQDLCALAGLLRSRGQDREAEALYRRALHGRQATLGRTHPDTLATLSYLTQLYREQGEPDMADRLYQQEIARH